MLTPRKKGFSSGSNGKESTCNAADPDSVPGSERSSRGGRQPTPVLLPGEFYGQRSLVGYSSWGCKESDITEWLSLSEKNIFMSSF